MADPHIIVALDYASAEKAQALARQLRPELCALKVGKELFTSAGPDLVRALVQSGFQVFLDLKFHDIPNTVAQACAAATRLGVWMLDVHASGGRTMMRAAREAVEREAAEQGTQRPLLIGVTVLTSMAAADLREIGVMESPAVQVLRLAALARDCGLDGAVCSAQEAALLRERLGADYCLVTPGIRLEGGLAQDQARVATPEAAVRAGAHYLVIGRTITEASDPVAMLEQIGDRLAKLRREET